MLSASEKSFSSSVMGKIWKKEEVHTGQNTLNHSPEMRMCRICLEKQKIELTG